jgi:hypothetical protein
MGTGRVGPHRSRLLEREGIEGPGHQSSPVGTEFSLFVHQPSSSSSRNLISILSCDMRMFAALAQRFLRPRVAFSRLSLRRGRLRSLARETRISLAFKLPRSRAAEPTESLVSFIIGETGSSGPNEGEKSNGNLTDCHGRLQRQGLDDLCATPHCGTPSQGYPGSEDGLAICGRRMIPISLVYVVRNGVLCMCKR